jgi:hypothetical protein
MVGIYAHLIQIILSRIPYQRLSLIFFYVTDPKNFVKTFSVSFFFHIYISIYFTNYKSVLQQISFFLVRIASFSILSYSFNMFSLFPA